MKKLTPFLLKQYRKMSGGKKIRIAFELSQFVREIYNAGKLARGAK